MRRFLPDAALVIGLMLGAAGLGLAQDAGAPHRSGGTASALSSEAPVQLTPALLADLPRRTQTIRFATSKGEFAGTFEGVLLWDVIKKAGIGLKGPAAAPDLGRSYVVSGRDGYAVVVSTGEIAPDYGNMPIMLADRVDGRALLPQDGFRLVAPGDARGGRSVRDVVSIAPR